MAAILLFVAVILHAQTQQPIPSPFAIREEILRKGGAYNTTALMRRLNLPVKFEFEASTVGFKRIALQAQVHPFTYEVYLLELCYGVNRWCRLIAFEGDSLAKPEESWKVRGYLDDANWRGFHFEHVDGWLALTRHVGSGTGISEYERSWFELTDSGFEERLRHTFHGHLAFAGEPRSKWSVHLLSTSHSQGSTSMTFLYYVSFEIDGPGSAPLDARRFVTFTRPNGSPRYQLDPARSELTAAEIARFFTANGRPTAIQIRAFARKSSK